MRSGSGAGERRRKQSRAAFLGRRLIPTSQHPSISLGLHRPSSSPFAHPCHSGPRFCTVVAPRGGTQGQELDGRIAETKWGPTVSPAATLSPSSSQRASCPCLPQFTSTSAGPCVRAVGYASKLTQILSVAGARAQASAPCASTALPMRAGGWNCREPTANAPTLGSQR